MIVFRFLKQVFGKSLMAVIGCVSVFALVGFVLYQLSSPLLTSFAVWLVIDIVDSFYNSKKDLTMDIPHGSLGFKRGAIAVGLGVIWLVSMILANIRAVSTSRSLVGVWVAGFGILFLIFGSLQLMWNRDSRLPAKRASVRKSPNYYK